MSPDRVAKLRLAGLLHDVGKIGITDSILQKPGPLTDAEFAIMKTHTRLGHAIVSAAERPDEAGWILHHHERLDGSGYPLGLVGEQIPLESRIILVADAFEAITADRPYRQHRSPGVALAELTRCSGTQFDPVCVEALRRCVASELREAA
jgi:HD-GYP domain-containing protein (c-di-GMP phosphodiesterase class II)